MVSKAFTTTANDSTASMSTLLPDIRINDMNDHSGDSGYSSLSQKFDKNKLNENLGKKTVSIVLGWVGVVLCALQVG